MQHNSIKFVAGMTKQMNNSVGDQLDYVSSLYI